MKKSERISILEKEVAELKLIVAKLREPSNLVKEELVKSNNELRAEVIEEAKSFIQYYENENWEFLISEKLNRVVTFNLKLKDVGIGFYQHKSKVFNEHIWKAIALGRALNLDVSEFENCVQPDIAVGQIIESLYKGKNYGDERFKYMEVINIDRCGNPEHDKGYYTSDYKILNDTNTIYEVK